MSSHRLAVRRWARSQHRASRYATLVASMICLLIPSTAPAGASSLRHAHSAPSFCLHLSSSKIDAIVGAKVTLAESTLKETVSACIYSGVAGNMSIETQSMMPSSQTQTLSLAEASAKAKFPPALKISFAPVSSGFGSVAFTWHAVIGVPYSGLNVIKGSTGYFVEMGGPLHLAELERLVRLAIAA